MEPATLRGHGSHKTTHTHEALDAWDKLWQVARRQVRRCRLTLNPIKPVLKAPGTTLLKLRCHGPLSNVAFKFNLRRRSQVQLSYQHPNFILRRMQQAGA